MTLEAKDVNYVDGTVRCRGWLVHDTGRQGRRPGVVLFPDARGVGEVGGVAELNRLAARPRRL